MNFARYKIFAQIQYCKLFPKLTKYYQINQYSSISIHFSFSKWLMHHLCHYTRHFIKICHFRVTMERIMIISNSINNRGRNKSLFTIKEDKIEEKLLLVESILKNPETKYSPQENMHWPFNSILRQTCV